MKRLSVCLISLALAGILIATGCSSEQNQNPGNGVAGSGEDNQTEEFSYTITEGGSTTVQPLAEILAYMFMEKHPEMTVTVQGGGSSVGIYSAANGTVDIGASSRELTPDEKAMSEPNLVTHLLARDGIAVITHPDVGIEDLSRFQVRRIFSGHENFSNWSVFGGPDEEIIVVAREEGSGTRFAFEDMVMAVDTVRNDAILQPSNGAVRTTVASTPNSIGFVSMAYIDESVKAVTIQGVYPTEATVIDDSYPLARPLYFITRGEPSPSEAMFIDYCLSEEGQQVVTDEGYVSILE